LFFYEEPNQPHWKVVLHKEPRSRRVISENIIDTVTLLDNCIGAKVPLEIPDLPSNTALVSAIELSGDDVILAAEALQRPFDDDEDVG
jgi:hypothetical protein